MKLRGKPKPKPYKLSLIRYRIYNVFYIKVVYFNFFLFCNYRQSLKVGNHCDIIFGYITALIVNLKNLLNSMSTWTTLSQFRHRSENNQKPDKHFLACKQSFP